MKMSSHSETRCQQRGISLDQVELIISYGQNTRGRVEPGNTDCGKRTKTDSFQRSSVKSR
jgi:hypothetical protein